MNKVLKVLLLPVFLLSISTGLSAMKTKAGDGERAYTMAELQFFECVLEYVKYYTSEDEIDKAVELDHQTEDKDALSVCEKTLNNYIRFKVAMDGLPNLLSGIEEDLSQMQKVVSETVESYLNTFGDSLDKKVEDEIRYIGKNFDYSDEIRALMNRRTLMMINPEANVGGVSFIDWVADFCSCKWFCDLFNCGD